LYTRTIVLERFQSHRERFTMPLARDRRDVVVHSLAGANFVFLLLATLDISILDCSVGID
jgi:hypothetical protein